MSYLLVVIVGLAGGWLAGQFLQESPRGIGVDLAAGVIGAYVVVVLIRAIGAPVTRGYVIGIIASVVGSMIAVVISRHFLKPVATTVTRTPRRRP